MVKWTCIFFGLGLGVVGVALLGVYGWSEVRIGKTYDVESPPVAIPTDSESVARGRHLATIRGCVDCHGEDLAGRTFIDALPVMARLSGSNLTRGRGGVAEAYGDADWIRAIRHGVGPDGKALLFMPSNEFWPMSDEDVGDLVAHIKAIPPVDRTPPENALGPVARLLFLKGDFPLVPAELVDHDSPRPDAPEEGRTPEYGAYLATGCVGCHGPTFSGGPIPGTPPDWPAASNLTPDPESGIGAWTEEDFVRALREGVRPDGAGLDPDYMPWPLTREMTDDEIGAIWAYVRSLPARPYGGR